MRIRMMMARRRRRRMARRRRMMMSVWLRIMEKLMRMERVMKLLRMTITTALHDHCRLLVMGIVASTMQTMRQQAWKR